MIFSRQPTTGLDPPQPPHHVADHPDGSPDGVTIFLTTQSLDEADQRGRPCRGADQRRIVAKATPPPPN